MDNIPKIIHIAWKHKHILDSQSPLILNGLRKLIDINPYWQVTIYTDEEIDEYLKVTLQEIDYKLIQDKHVVAKTDIWRLLKLYLEGGLYIDIDRFCNIKLSELATDNIKWVLDYDIKTTNEIYPQPTAKLSFPKVMRHNIKTKI